MHISIFEVTGPVMIGPSSSHTAGAARLSRMARNIAGRPFTHVSFGLHGSFAKTYKGHGTDKALVAGALGLFEDDDRLSYAFDLATRQGLSYVFYETELEGFHENTVKMTFDLEDGSHSEIIGSSIGGGQIVLRRIDGFDVELSGRLPTLLIRQKDERGIISEVSRILASNGINIGIMKLSRTARGDTAFCVIETDDAISPGVAKSIEQVSGVISVGLIPASAQEG